MSDPRFSRFKTDPRFRKLRRKQNKVIVDERFKSIFSENEKGVSKTARVDKYGRKLAKSHDTENLKRFYRLEGDEELVASSVPDYARGEILMESSDEDAGEAEDSDLDDDAPVVLGKNFHKPIPIEEEIEIDLDESQFAELDALAEANIKQSKEEEEMPTTSNDETSRLAVVNLDWDHIKASHLYKIFSSTLTLMPKKGAVVAPIGKILNVRIYPSEFGKTQMEREAREGPPKEIFKTRNDDDPGNVQEDNGAEYDEDALRKYQLQRLRYYYAIVTCDTVKAAAHIVSELDGTELERSANTFDLSYVPEDMSFGNDYTDEASEVDTTYKGLEFVTDALRHSKVKLTWDADDPERVKMTRRAFSKKELQEADFKAFLASASSEEGSDEGDNAQSKREKIRSLLLQGTDGDNELLPEGWGKDFDKAGDMEITFTPGLSGSTNNVDPEEETTLQRYVRKEKEKRKKRKDEKSQKTNQDNGLPEDDFFGEDESDGGQPPSGKNNLGYNKSRSVDVAEIELLQSTLGETGEPNHFNMRDVIKAEKNKTKKRRKERKRNTAENAEEIQEDFVLDVNDSRFRALHEDHAFAIDPSNPHFKKTKNMSVLLEERARRQRLKQTPESSIKNPAPSHDNADERNLRKLVENVKRKSTLSDGPKNEGKRRKMS